MISVIAWRACRRWPRAAGTVFTLTTPIAPQGNHTAAVLLDYGCVLPESNEANNRYGPVNVEVGPPQYPDLVVTGVTTNPSAPIEGEAMYFVVTVRNQGTERGPLLHGGRPLLRPRAGGLRRRY